MGSNRATKCDICGAKLTKDDYRASQSGACPQHVERLKEMKAVVRSVSGFYQRSKSLKKRLMTQEAKGPSAAIGSGSRTTAHIDDFDQFGVM